MTIQFEKEIFKRAHIDFNKLNRYGFAEEGGVYKYSEVFMDNFRADIFVYEEGVVSGKIYDLNTGDEYTNFRIENQAGKFINSIRQEYQNILKDICNSCFDKLYFVSEQANRIAGLIEKTYHDEPEFLWETSPKHGVFRNPYNNKWYGIIMNIDKGKIDKSSTGEIEVINVKLDSAKIPLLLKKEGFYPAYHMNKKNWITIVLDNTLSDEEILAYIKESHIYTETSGEWVVPANPKFYDVINCFNDTDTVIWKQSGGIKKGDKVYLYVAKPYSAILYKCEVIDVNIPYEYRDENISMNKVMKIKLLERYDKDVYSFAKLNEYGIKAIRGPRRMPEELSKEMNFKM